MSRPDGYFMRTELQFGASKPHWMNIAVTGEYKKQTRVHDINDVCLSSRSKCRCSFLTAWQDNRKAIWNMHHTLREDPLRRFTYAFTVENTTIRFWYASRSDILVSQAFDIMKVIASLCQVCRLGD